MSELCSSCNNKLPKNGDFVECGECKKYLHHGKCSGISKEIWRAKSDKIKKQWKCGDCRKLPTKETHYNKEKSDHSGDDDDVNDCSSIDLTWINANNKILNGRIDELMATITELKDSVIFITNEYDTMKSENNELKEEIAKLKNLHTKVERIEKTQREEHTKASHQRQYERNKNIEIVGVERKPDEDLKDVVCKIAEKIGLESKELENIDIMHRIPCKTESSANKREKEKTKKHENIIIQFKNRQSRDEWLKKKVRITNEDIYGANGDSREKVFINENLIPELKRPKQQQKRKNGNSFGQKTGKYWEGKEKEQGLSESTTKKT